MHVYMCRHMGYDVFSQWPEAKDDDVCSQWPETKDGDVCSQWPETKDGDVCSQSCHNPQAKDDDVSLEGVPDGDDVDENA